MPPCQWPFANFYTCIHVHVCMCMHVCGGHPPCPKMPPDTPQTPAPSPELQGAPKHQNSISLELIEIIQFCLKILYLWTLLNSYRLCLVTPDTPHPPAPAPRAKQTQIRRITITLERIEIIQFCLKIWDPWTLLHTYRLELMCGWGCPIPKGTFIFWTQKFTSFSLLWPSNKNVPVFALDPSTPHLDWALKGFWPPNPFTTFQIWLEMKTKVPNLT